MRFGKLMILAAVLLLIALSWPQPAHAQWTNDPYSGMVTVTAAENNQQSFRIARFEGSGSTMVFWNDLRNPDLVEAYYQILSLQGVALLTPDGEPLIAGATYRTEAAYLLSDGLGGVIAIFERYQDSTSYSRKDIYGQRFDPYGNPLWGPTGLPLVVWPGAEDVYIHDVTYDSQGNFFIAWVVDGGLTGGDLYVQKSDSLGTTLWGNNGYGVPASTATGHQIYAQAVPDQQGGVTLVWEDDQEGSYNNYLYAQHLDENGDPLWQINGIPLYYPGTPTQMLSGAMGDGVSDGEGGGIWDFSTPGTHNTLQLFRMTGEGRVLWYWVSNYGTRFGAPDLLRHPADGTVWFSDIGDLHRFDVNGNPLFGQAGLDDLGGKLTAVSNGVISTQSNQVNPYMVRIFSQRVNDTGQLLWVCDVALGAFDVVAYYGSTSSDGNDGAIIAFTDYRNQGSTANSDIAAQRVLWYGQLGNPPLPKIPISGNLQGLSGPTAGVLRLELSQPGEITLEFFDLLGRRVALLREGYYPAGDYTVRLNDTMLPSGVYIAYLKTPTTQEALKVVIAR